MPAAPAPTSSIGDHESRCGEALEFAGEGKIAAHFSWDKLENINAIFECMEEGRIDGRIVLDLNG
ncbi:alcohol dehydrogenase [Ensifer psoraleae]|nr:alcohol dehydrogenase [Sinorhizobium psoraleae]